MILAVVSQKMPSSSRSSKKEEVQLSPMGQTNHGIPKTYRATVEPSDVLRDSRATRDPEHLQHTKKCQYLFFRSNRASNIFNVFLPISRINFPGTTETRMIAQATCMKTEMT